jgi:hypothetical protein
MAISIVEKSFSPHQEFGGETGAELRSLVEAYCDEDHLEWLNEDPDRYDLRLSQVKSRLDSELARFANRRLFAPLVQAPEAATFYRFLVIPTGAASPEEVALRKRYELHHLMIDALRSVDPDEFEQICGALLSAVGCTEVHVSRGSKDFGVDCFGRLAIRPREDGNQPISVQTTASMRLLGDLHLILFGQAKRYGTTKAVQAKEVKELEATLGDIQRQHFDRKLIKDLRDGLEKVKWVAADTVLLVFITTSSYTRGALEFAQRQGMAAIDGDQLAQLLLDAALGVREEADGSWSTDTEILVEACAAAA